MPRGRRRPLGNVNKSDYNLLNQLHFLNIALTRRTDKNITNILIPKHISIKKGDKTIIQSVCVQSYIDL